MGMEDLLIDLTYDPWYFLLDSTFKILDFLVPNMLYLQKTI